MKIYDVYYAKEPDFDCRPNDYEPTKIKETHRLVMKTPAEDLDSKFDAYQWANLRRA